MNPQLTTFRRRFLALAFTASLTMLATLHTACARKLELTKLEAAGHAISAEIDGAASIESQADFAVITSPHGRVCIEAERVRLDDLDWTAISADVPVSVRITPGRVRIAAGKVTVGRTVSN
jgi:hypothetical protein